LVELKVRKTEVVAAPTTSDAVAQTASSVANRFGIDPADPRMGALHQFFEAVQNASQEQMEGHHGVAPPRPVAPTAAARGSSRRVPNGPWDAPATGSSSADDEAPCPDAFDYDSDGHHNHVDSDDEER